MASFFRSAPASQPTLARRGRAGMRSGIPDSAARGERRRARAAARPADQPFQRFDNLPPTSRQGPDPTLSAAAAANGQSGDPPVPEAAKMARERRKSHGIQERRDLPRRSRGLQPEELRGHDQALRRQHRLDRSRAGADVQRRPRSSRTTSWPGGSRRPPTSGSPAPATSTPARRWCAPSPSSARTTGRSDRSPPPARSSRCRCARCGTSTRADGSSVATSTTTRSRCSRSWA